MDWEQEYARREWAAIETLLGQLEKVTMQSAIHLGKAAADAPTRRLALLVGMVQALTIHFSTIVTLSRLDEMILQTYAERSMRDLEDLLPQLSHYVPAKDADAMANGIRGMTSAFESIRGYIQENQPESN